MTDARFRVNHALLALVLLIPGFVLTRNLVVLIHLLCPDALYSTTHALARSLFADDDRLECHRSLAAVAILRLQTVGVGCGNGEGREEGRHTCLRGYARERVTESERKLIYRKVVEWLCTSLGSQKILSIFKSEINHIF